MGYTPPSPAAIALAEGSGRVDPEDPPASTPVRLLADCGGSSKPQVLVGTTSSTGKTVTIGREGDTRHRLPSRALFTGKRIERGDHWYELYRPERFRDLFEATIGREQRLGEVPEPTHLPATEQQEHAPAAASTGGEA